MKKIISMLVLFIAVFTLSGCNNITEDDAQILLSSTLQSLQGSESIIFHIDSTSHDKLIALNMEDYYDTIILRYTAGDMDYRYLNYVEVRENNNGDMLYYPVYYECGNNNPNCPVPSYNIYEYQTLEEESLYLYGERDEYAYLKGNDQYFDFYKFLDIAQGVIEYAKRDEENNIIIDNVLETEFNFNLLGDSINIESYTFDIYLDLETLRTSDPELFQALYWLDTNEYNLVGVEQVITLEVDRQTNELLSFKLDQSFSNQEDPSIIPFARDYIFTISLLENGEDAYDYMNSHEELKPTPLTNE